MSLAFLFFLHTFDALTDGNEFLRLRFTHAGKEIRYTLGQFIRRSGIRKRNCIQAKLGELWYFLVVEAANQNGVDLNLLEACVQRRVEPRHCIIKAAPARDAGVFLCVQRIQTQVHARYSGSFQICRVLRKQNAVRRDADLADARNSGAVFADGDDVFLYQRLAARDAKLLYAEGSCGFDSLYHLFFRQHVAVRFFENAFLRHTVPAAQIAPLGHR